MTADATSSPTQELITWQDFERVELRVGTIVAAEPNVKARNPAYILTVDLGETLGVRRSSAQITAEYEPAELIGKQVICVVNFPVKKIAGFASEMLVTGIYRENGNVVLVSPDKPVHNGARLG